MLSIKLSRTGKKKQPYYRIIVLEKHKDPWGDYLENLGNYNPRSKELVINQERLKYWVSVGAQMSNTVNNLMIKQGLVEGKPKKAVRISDKRRTKLEDKKKADADAATAKATKEKAAKVAAEEKPAEPVVDESAAEEKPAPAEEAKPEEVNEEKAA
ncbi:MAG: 30S ribosomal protein S16 [Candidatus Komeilibacteria bacterium]|nr:30S ribosomal protein S16 [Candidatus Komeilibacteria bacterium]